MIVATPQQYMAQIDDVRDRLVAYMRKNPETFYARDKAHLPGFMFARVTALQARTAIYEAKKIAFRTHGRRTA